MTTKTAKEPKPKALTKTEKAAAKMAYDEGRQAQENGNVRGACLHDEPHLREAWHRGWDEADETAKSVDEASEQVAPMTGAEQLEQHGHNVTDPAVVSRETDLAALCQAFDNHGVSIVESQWRYLSDEDQGIAARWLNNRKIGVLSPVPYSLLQYSTDALKKEYSMYADEQRLIRKVVMLCEFGKHSETKPDGDDSEPRIKMTLKVPIDDLSASTANELFGWKRSRVEFGRRSVNTWDQLEIPGAGQTFACIADISGFSRNRTHWKFGFFIDMTEISLEQAYDLWKSTGSCRVEPISDIPEESKRSESENPENEADDDEPAELRKPVPSLFDAQETEKDMEVDEQGFFVDPLEFGATIRDENASCLISIGIGPDGRVYMEQDLMYSANGIDSSLGDQYPKKSGDGFKTIPEAVKAGIGKLIDRALVNNVDAAIIDDLRNELKRLEAGGDPLAYPRENESV